MYREEQATAKGLRTNYETSATQKALDGIWISSLRRL